MNWEQDSRAAEAVQWGYDDRAASTDFAREARAAPPYGAAAGWPQGGTPTYDISTERLGPPQQGAWNSSDEESVEDPDHYEYEDVEETAYSGAMATVIKDANRLAIGSDYPGSRWVRIFFAMGMALVLIACQLFTLFTIKTYVTSPAVRSIRKVYGHYQEQMYHGHVEDSGFGIKLGIGGPRGPFFDPKQFDDLSGDLKGNVCLIPFSQPGYLFIILFIWCLSVVGELRVCMTQLGWLCQIPRVATLSAMIKQVGEDHIIVGLPAAMKALVFSLVLLPRAITALVLLYLGSRWLTATLDFTEVLINAIALEFVIHMNALFYEQLVSDRSKRENRGMKFDMSHKKGRAPSVFAFIGTAMWTITAIVWVYSYMNYLQMVLPGYQWDVAGPCKSWVEKRFDFWRI